MPVCCNFSNTKEKNMNPFKMIMIAALNIFSVAVFAQDTTKQKPKMQEPKMQQVKYSCPMHPDVTSNKPGKCPKCGMDLVRSEKKQMKMAKTYTCSMHPEVSSDKPGKCPKCGMDLIEKKKHDHANRH
jgi:predicted RNA-binding Zn-ribbon protein involved in translation (DUF1610 family)